MKRNNVLILDDEPEIGAFVAAVAEGLGCDAQTTETLEQFEQAFQQCPPELIVSDLQLGEHDGVEVLRLLAQAGYSGAVVLVSGFDTRVLHTSERLGSELGLTMAGSLEKPILIDDLEATITAALPKQHEDISVSMLEEAIDAGEMVPYYQPKLDLAAGRITGFEALVRWDRPGKVVLPPDAFLPLIASENLMPALTDAVVEAVAKQCASWKDAGFGDVGIAINIDAALINDLSYPDHLFSAFRNAGATPRDVTLEITETGVMSNAAKTLDILSRLRLKGFKLSLDDFGTGYSSMIQLYRMPFSELKIDRSFVSNCDTDREAEAIVRLSVDLANRLGLSVCAEGVEREEEAEFLRMLKCGKAQGYLWSPPVPGVQATDLLRMRAPDLYVA